MTSTRETTMQYETGLAKAVLACAAVSLSAIACNHGPVDDAWLELLHNDARDLFYQTVEERIADHPELERLTEPEIRKITEVRTRYQKLPDILLNVYYQQDGPLYSQLIERGGSRAQSRIREEYLALALFAANQFVECFFTTDEATDTLKAIIPGYADLDAVDLVLRSIGYDAQLDVPEREPHTDSLSPEFDRQAALDAARFREAHRLTKGAGTKIAILDTGIDTHHSIFANTNMGRHFSLVGRTGAPWSADAPVVDWGGHGTAIASIATRYAPEAQITSYKFGDGVLQNDPPYQLLMQAMLAATIYRAVHDGNDIISISAAGATLDSDYLREAVRYAFEQNRVVISGSPYQRWTALGFTRNFPGQYPTVVSVTAVEKKEGGAYGYWEVCARDSATTVAAPNDIFAALPTYMELDDQYIPSISAAIPTVAAVFALSASVYPRLDTDGQGEYVQALTNLVTENANSAIVGHEGFSAESGYGMIDALATVQDAQELSLRRAQQRP
jgi:subtilisin family serine protease